VKVVTTSGNIYWISREHFDDVRQYRVPITVKAKVLKNLIVSNRSFLNIYIVSVYFNYLRSSFKNATISIYFHQI